MTTPSASPQQHDVTELINAIARNTEAGCLGVNIHTDKGMVHLAIVGPGSVVGEGSFFSRLARSASVSAYSDCKVWVMLPAEFDRLSRANAHVALALSMALGTLMATRTLDLAKRVVVI